MSEHLWLFGYGSIMWKTGLQFDHAALGFIRHRARRFWQGSPDHRGTPSAHGRVVTLTDRPGTTCWGMVYRIPADSIEEAIRDLDHREKGGYIRERVEIVMRDGELVSGITYYADTTNPHFLGEADTHQIALQILNSKGPSGTNKQYILTLDETLRSHGIRDDHVSELAELVQTLSALRD